MRDDQRELVTGREPAVRIRSTSNAPALGGVAGTIRRLQNGDPPVRAEAADHLVGYGDKAVARLGQLLIDRREDVDLQLLVIRVLERIDTPRACQAIRLAVRSPSFALSLTAQDVLARRGEKPSRLRAWVARLTGRAPPSWKDLEGRLLHVLDQPTGPDPDSQLAILRDFLRLGRRGPSCLLRLTDHPVHAVRIVLGLATIAAEHIPHLSEAAMKLLARLLAHSHPDVVRLAADSLAEVGPSVFDLLEESFRAGNAVVRTRVVAILGAIGHAKALPLLLQSLQDGDARVRQAAALALESWNHPLSKEAQAAVSLHRRDWKGLAQLGSAAVPILLAELARGNRLDRVAIVAVLGQIGDFRAIPALREQLREPDHHVRQAAVLALGQIGHPSTITALKEATRDPHHLVRWTAEQVLAGFTKV